METQSISEKQILSFDSGKRWRAFIKFVFCVLWLLLSALAVLLMLSIGWRFVTIAVIGLASVCLWVFVEAIRLRGVQITSTHLICRMGTIDINDIAHAEDRMITRYSDETCLVRVHLKTGRTIPIHNDEIGYDDVGDFVKCINYAVSAGRVLSAK